MPKAMEKALRKKAHEMFDRIKNPQVREDRMDRFIYGTMRKTGWVPKREKR